MSESPDSSAMPPFPELQPSLGDLNQDEDIPDFPTSLDWAAMPASPELDLPPFPDFDSVMAGFADPDPAASPDHHSPGMQASPDPDSPTIPAFPDHYSPAMPDFPGPASLIGRSAPPDSTQSAMVVLQSPSITGLGEMPTLDELVRQVKSKGKSKEISYPKVLARSSPNEGNRPANKKLASTSLAMALNPQPKKQNTSGPAQSSALAASPPRAAKRDLGQDFRRLGDERKLDPNYFKVCFVISLFCILDSIRVCSRPLPD